MLYTIEIREKKGIYDAVGEGVKKDILDLGITTVEDVKFIQVYFIEGGLNQSEIKLICERLLTDPITQEYTYKKSNIKNQKSKINPKSKIQKKSYVVEVAYNPGVMDPVEESAKKGIMDLGIKKEVSVKTAKKYILEGRLKKDEIDFISDKLLHNKAIQHIVKSIEHSLSALPPYEFKKIEVDILSAGSHELLKISKDGQLFLNLYEMTAIKKYFKKLGRNPTDCELESIAQTWSEHCKHKTLRGLIRYNGKTINNLLKNTVMKATKQLNKKWCVSVFKDNSGVIEFDKNYDVCFKVETHNHPSALEPYGGAGTGIGGVIRDPLGTGRGAKPILNTDVFCFGPPDIPHSKIPKGTLHPKRIMKGVVGGVRDYGNRMGIPTVNGAVLFDERYIGNPLVYCGNVGILPRGLSTKRVDPGDLILLVGGRTGRDGIHGATFSSGELTEESETISGQAVQIGNPITEKKVVDTILNARDKNLYKAITDCGGGGLSSAVGEMGEKTGVEVNLEKVPLKYEGLSYTEIWISEAQERMILAVPKKNINRILKIFKDENVEAVAIGAFTKTKKLHLLYKGKTVANLDMEFLHNGVPKIRRTAVWKKTKHKDPKNKEPKDLAGYLLKILSSPNVCSKEWIIRQYDHEVQGGSVLKPLVGVNCDGPGDASVVRPLLDSKKGIAVSNGINFLYSLIDPYWMAASCIDEAIRQIIAVGGNLERIAILDNFCWGNTNNPKTLGSLVRAAIGCYDIAKYYGVPFISGKDSLNNEYKSGRKTISIPPTLLISAIGIIDNIENIISMDFKNAGNFIYVVGKTYDEMGGSHYWKLLGHLGNHAPKINKSAGKKTMNKLSDAINKKQVISCHDCSEGGIGVAVSEMAFAGGIGADISLQGAACGKNIKRNDVILFSESNSRFIVEVPKSERENFEKSMKGVPIGLIGQTKPSNVLRVEGLDGRIIVQTTLGGLKDAWQAPFREW